MNIIIVLILLAILFSLFRGLFYLVKDRSESKRTVNSLTWRIGLSVFLFLLIMAGLFTGAIKPGDPFRQPPSVEQPSK